MDPEVYKAAILEFVACMIQDRENVETCSELTPGQTAAFQWYVLSVFMIVTQFEFSD